ncbi:hypothetical protein [Adlercreutzia sp. ZJ473]|uniref:hypothetical protein n=1 Tax=Adlercreutzia sp. ZJ473 TaxID=2722822 RepID=UPI001554AAB9|nr:hypothetical protein [Adlercreutzia sp. ZJ473]
MPQKRTGFTTMVDLAEFEKTTWAFLTNVKMVWEYNGIAFLFREAGIPLYGLEKGTIKMNHPVIGMVIPPSKDKNYGVDIYVPAEKKAKAAKLIANRERVKKCAELELSAGPAHYDAFYSAARTAKAAYDRQRHETRWKRRREKLSSLLPSFATRI